MLRIGAICQEPIKNNSKPQFVIIETNMYEVLELQIGLKNYRPIYINHTTQK